MTSANIWVAVAGGGAIGAAARFAVGQWSLRAFGPGFPWATLIVNVAGSFAMGLVIAWLAGKSQASEAVRAFLSVGLLGAFTTFSTFSLDVVALYERKNYLAAAGYLSSSVVLSILALFIGLWAGRSFS